MKYQNNIGNILKKYGSAVTLLPVTAGAASRTYNAFIQPLRYKNKMYLDGVRTPLGLSDESHYLYIGPPEVDLCSLSPRARISMNGVNFYITRAERVMVSGNTVYIWAVLRTACQAGAAA